MPVDPARVARDPQNALIVGWGNTGDEFFGGNPGALGVVNALFVHRVDGTLVVDSNVVRLPTGRYQLTIACRIFLDGRFVAVDSDIPVRVEAGRVYRLRARARAVACGPYLEEVEGVVSK